MTQLYILKTAYIMNWFHRMFLPRLLSMPPIEVRSGKYEDCKNICYMNYQTCKYFTFYTEEFIGELKSVSYRITL